MQGPVLLARCARPQQQHGNMHENQPALLQLADNRLEAEMRSFHGRAEALQLRAKEKILLMLVLNCGMVLARIVVL